jgi:hypothetical protein
MQPTTKKYLILLIIICCGELGKSNQKTISQDMCGYVINNNDYKRNICLLNCLNYCPNNNNPSCSMKCDKFCCS